MSILSQIQALQADKAAIASAITAKGGTVTGGFDTFALDIEDMPSGTGGYGNYNIVTTENADGTQNLAITDASVLALEEKTITATTSSQTITPDGSYIGFNKVNVNAVTSSIDSNIVAGNIKKSVTILGVTGTYEDTTVLDGDAAAANVLSGKTFYSNSKTKQTGTMTNNGAVSGTISAKAGIYSIPSGYHNGSGTVSISSTEQDKIIPSNIASGVTILGVTGTHSGGITPSGTLNITANGTYNVSSYASAKVDVSGGGAQYISPMAYMESTITSFSSDAPGILDYAFILCTELSTVSFPNCSYIGNCAFQECYSLESAVFPNCEYIAADAFVYCENISYISIPNCSYIDGDAFDGIFIKASNFNIGSMSAEGDYYGATVYDEMINSIYYLYSNDSTHLWAVKGTEDLITASNSYCSGIQSYAFRECENLTTLSFPNCSYISTPVWNTYMLSGVLTYVSLPNLTSIDGYESDYMFNGMVFKTSQFNIGIMSSTGSLYGATICDDIIDGIYYMYSSDSTHLWAFSALSSITSASNSYCIGISGNTFAWNGQLSTVSFPNCSYIGNCAFAGCTGLQSLSFPNCSYIGDYAFTGCTGLQSLSFPNCSYIGDNAFTGCTNLLSVYLMSTSIVSIQITTFTNTPMIDTAYTGQYGSIYVPASLLSTYQASAQLFYTLLPERFVGV